jgi:hypothetical protein
MVFFATPFKASRLDLALVCGGLALVGTANTANGQCVERHFFASDGGSTDFFGHSAAISGDTAVVGAWFENNTGAAYVFERSGATWIQQAHLVGAPSETFGASVAISGDTLVAGAVGAEAVYVFERNAGVWTEQARISPFGPRGDFGSSVAISGDTVLVGAYTSDSAYVFVRNAGVWTQQPRLWPSDGAAGDRFGWSVALSGETAVVGSIDAAKAYVYVRNGATWREEARLSASDGSELDFFGVSVAISGDTVIVGAGADDTSAGSDAGSAYVFVRSGGLWTEQAHLLPADGRAGDHFGTSVQISGDMAVVGAPLRDTPGIRDAGSTYVFTRSGAVWTQQAQLFAPDAAQGDEFGLEVASSGNSVVVSAPWDNTYNGLFAGSAYVFNLDCCSGDLDGSGVVDLSDLAILLAHFGTVSGATLADGDFEGDGDVDLGDLANMLSVTGTTCS